MNLCEVTSKSLINRFNFFRSFKTAMYRTHRETTDVVCSCRNNFPVYVLPKGIYRQYSSENKSNDSPNESQDDTPAQSQEIKIPGASLQKYKAFEDFDSPVILDVDEERRLRLDHPEFFDEEVKKTDEFEGMNLQRGVNGVFDVEELVDILRNEKAKHVVTIRIAPEFKYADYMVIVSARSEKHLYTMADYIRRLFKRKKHESDRIPKIEGATDKTKVNDWLALDMGNIILHLFLHRTRLKYDLETLWAVGREYDDLTHAKEDQYISLLQQHTVTGLEDLVPLENSESEEKKDLA